MYFMFFYINFLSFVLAFQQKHLTGLYMYNQSDNQKLDSWKPTITTLAKCAETRAYTPPDEPTTGAVISVTDTARDPAVMRKEQALG